MLSQKLFKLINKIALCAIVFASLAPTISHALAAQQGLNSFTQEVCTTDGKKITIQVVTSKGQQLTTELNAESTQEKSPTGIQHHLQHCPFCANPSTDAAIQAPHASIIVFLSAQAQHVAATFQVDLPRFFALPPPAQAPPALL
jgi:Protein of unknown function (DUF2946)